MMVPKKFILITFVLFICFRTPSYAIDVTLEWDPSPDAQYYVVYWRTASQNYDVPRSANVGLSTTYDFSKPDDTYFFVVRAVDDPNIESYNSREICVLDPGTLAPYNRGWAITDGDLKGFMVHYNDNAPDTPTLGPSGDIPSLHQSVQDVQGVGLAVNLQPSGTDFTPDNVKIFIPCPGYSDPSGLNIYFYDDLGGADWILAWDGSEQVMTIPGHDWLAAPPIPHGPVGNTMATYEVIVKHFSGAQAAAPAGPTLSGGGGGGGGCFVSTARRGVLERWSSGVLKECAWSREKGSGEAGKRGSGEARRPEIRGPAYAKRLRQGFVVR